MAEWLALPSGKRGASSSTGVRIEITFEGIKNLNTFLILKIFKQIKF